MATRAAHRATPSPAPSRSAASCSTTSSSASSPRATSSSRTCRASARRRSPARSRASLDLQFARVQCTADLLPADVVGTNVFNQREDRFEFRPGPIFANVVLVDEINRASPKTQSGLLECMQERRVTVDVHTHELARPFLVLATQNPVEFEGTYPLPEAQVDRFMVPACRSATRRPRARSTCSRAHETRRPRRGARARRDGRRAAGARRTRRCACTPPTRCARYVVSAAAPHPRRTRASSSAASPRAGLLLLRAAKARALLQGRDHALPDDVQALAEVVLSHRIVLAPEAHGHDRRGGDRRRAGGDAGALAGRRGRPARRRRPRVLGARCCCSTAAIVRRRAALRARRRASSPWPPGAAPGSSRGARGVRVTRAVDARRVARGRAASPLDARACARARSALPAGELAGPAAARSRRRSPPGATAPSSTSRRASRAAGASVLAPPRVVVRDPLRPRRAHRRRAARRRRGARAAAHRARAQPRAPRRRRRDRRAAAGARRRRRGRPRRPAPAPRRARRPRASSGRRWPAAASCMERRLRAEADTRPLVVLDPRAPAADEDLDAAVRAAASLSVHLARHGGCALLLPGRPPRPPASSRRSPGWPHAARAPGAARGRAPGRRSAASASRRGPVLLRRARAARPARRGRWRSAPAAGRILVVPGALAGRRAAFEVAGCTGYELVERHVRPRRRLRPETVDVSAPAWTRGPGRAARRRAGPCSS